MAYSSPSSSTMDRSGKLISPNLASMLQQYKLVEMKFLAQQRDFQALIADFEVSEGIYLRACIEDADSVCLWLEANVMLEYSCDKVNMARVYNWDVHQSRSCWYFYRFMKQTVYYSPNSESGMLSEPWVLGSLFFHLPSWSLVKRLDPIRFLVGKRYSSKS